MFTFFNELLPSQLTQAGTLADFDNQSDLPETQLSMPWLFDPNKSWLEYRCGIEVRLDSGLVCHYPLPQTNTDADSLASYTIDSSITGAQMTQQGVNTVARAAVTNVVQRMSPSRYTFILSGLALRAGYQIPIPGLKTVAGVPAFPDEIQIASQEIVGNLSGIPLWFAHWELWYFVALPPKAQQLPPDNLGLHMPAAQELPTEIQMPYSQPDQNFTQVQPPPGLGGFFTLT